MIAFNTSLTVLLAAFACGSAAMGISYTITYQQHGTDRKTWRGGEVPNDKVDELVANLDSWSGGKYRAQKVLSYVRVTNVHGCSADEVNAMFHDMESIIVSHIPGARK